MLQKARESHCKYATEARCLAFSLMTKLCEILMMQERVILQYLQNFIKKCLKKACILRVRSLKLVLSAQVWVIKRFQIP